ncbi:MAG: LysR family transcriptional regulator [Myxococcales bacterium FL481]|nr:MAG: LysR family transcriptional regulator [Myxococcales bacterium FL481]
MTRDASETDALAFPALLPQLAAFVAVVSAGSFTAAARRAGIDKTLLSRRVRSLEAALQVRLLNRTTRRLHVTQAGQALYERVSQPLSEVADGLARAARDDTVEGQVRVATFPALGQSLWGPALRELLDAHPLLALDVRATETLVNLVEQGFDVGIRAGKLPDSSFVARRLATWRHVLVASPGWADRHPEVRTPADLVSHWVLYTDVPMANQWRFERGDEGLEVRMHSRLTLDNGEVQLGSVLAGIGVTATAPYHVERYLERGDLVRLLPDWRVAHRHGIYAVTPHRTYTPARVQVVCDTVARHLERLSRRWASLSD